MVGTLLKIHLRESWLVIAGIQACCLVGCTTNSPSTARQAICCSPASEATTATGRLFFEIDSLWETDAGQRVRLDELRGRPQIVAMFYSSCHVACPLTIQTMKWIESKLPESSRSRIGFLLITFDPADDTPRALRTFRKAEQLNGNHWTLLRGSVTETKKAAAILGVSFKKESFRLTHTSQIAVLDAEGRMIFRQENLRASPDDAFEAVQSLLSAPHSP